MAVTVVFGTSQSGKSRYCFEEMKQWSAQGGKALLIVPDQASYSAERQFAESMEGHGFMGIQIVGFSRLAYRVLQERGKDHAALSELSQKIILQRLLRQHAEKLTVLKTAARQDNFVETVGSFIAECRSFGISTAMLRQAGEALEGRTLGKKINDIALLYEQYNDFLEQRFGSADDVMTVLAREIGAYRFLQGARVWVDGFQWFTPQQLDVLQEAARAASDMTITLTLDASQLKRQAKETALFHRAYEVYRELQQRFAVVAMKALPSPADEGLHLFWNHFFQPIPQSVSTEADGLWLCECSNRDVEIDRIARKIQQLCREGYRYRDFLLLARTSDAYQAVAERIFASYGIPFFSDYRRPMTTHPVVEAIIALLDVFRNHWSYESLFELLKTDLFPLCRHDVDILENYCLAHGIQGYHWLSGKEWTYGKRTYIDGPAKRDEKEEAHIAAINEIRAAVVDTLLPLWQEAQQDHALRDWCTLLYQWLTKLQVPQTLRTWKHEDSQTKQAVDEKEHEQVWKRILLFLNEIVHLCGDDVVSLEEFAHIVTDGLGELTFSLIPPTLDHVTLTSVERGYTMQGRVVFLCGVNDGMFPQHSREEGMLNDAERRNLTRLGLKLGPSSRFRSFQEKFLFYLAVTRAREALYISYVLAGEDGAAMEPSTWVQQLVEKGYVTDREREGGTIAAGTEPSFITTMPAALSWLPTMLRPAVDGKPTDDVWWALYDWAYKNGWKKQALQVVQGLFHRNVPQLLLPDVVRTIYAPDGTLRGSVTKFEQYRSCPFAYFSRYGLQLKERQIYQFAAPDLGMLIHGALRMIGQDLLNQGKQWHDLKTEDIPMLCRNATEALAPHVQHNILMSNAYFEQIKERLIQTLTRTVQRLQEFSSVSDFHMVGLEKSFGREQSNWKAVQFTVSNGMKVVVSGQIDRVDVMRTDEATYVVVIDYKSGKKQLDVGQIFTGMELQLVTYMDVALQNIPGSTAPAAILYCYVRNDKETLDSLPDEEAKKDNYNKNSKLKGFYLDDGDVMKALDTSLNGYSAFLNIQMKKDGTMSNTTHVMYNGSAWKHMLSVSSKRLRQIAEQITTGDISIRPIRIEQKTPCSFCPYHAVCRFDAQLSENSYEIVAKAKPQEWIDKINNEGAESDGVD